MGFGFPPRFADSRTFFAPPDELKVAVESTFQKIGWSYRSASVEEFVAQTPFSGFSWGEEVKLKILPNGVVQVESRCHGARPQIIDYGKNKANVGLFFAQLQHEVALGPDAPREPAAVMPAAQVASKSSPGANIFFGCLVTVFALFFLVTMICAVVGLLTGNLYLLGRGGDLTLHGAVARIVSAVILIVFGWATWRVLRMRKRRK